MAAKICRTFASCSRALRIARQKAKAQLATSTRLPVTRRMKMQARPVRHHPDHFNAPTPSDGEECFLLRFQSTVHLESVVCVVVCVCVCLGLIISGLVWLNKNSGNGISN